LLLSYDTAKSRCQDLRADGANKRRDEWKWKAHTLIFYVNRTIEKKRDEKKTKKRLLDQQQHHSGTASQGSVAPAAPQYRRSTAPLHNFTASQHHSSTVSQHHSTSTANHSVFVMVLRLGLGSQSDIEQAALKAGFAASNLNCEIFPVDASTSSSPSNNVVERTRLGAYTRALNALESLKNSKIHVDYSIGIEYGSWSADGTVSDSACLCCISSVVSWYKLRFYSAVVALLLHCCCAAITLLLRCLHFYCIVIQTFSLLGLH
jgi:hypothetical protein